MADRYRFGQPIDSMETYSTGEMHPHRMQILERSTDNGATWQGVGYIEIHTHRVVRDAADVEDISLGFTGRVNPRVGK